MPAAIVRGVAVMSIRALALAAVVLAATNLIAAEPNDDPAALRRDLLQHREAEAATKERLAKAQLVAPPATVNQTRYDVTHYDLDLTVTPATSTLAGTVATTATVTGAGIAVVELDLSSNMVVSAARVNGAATTFTRSGQLVSVNLDRTYSAGENVTVALTYSGNPAGEFFGWDSHAGLPMIWSLSEPFGARSWWPCKDSCDDKADAVDIRVTLPDNLVVASQGLLVSDVDNGSTRTFHWHTDYPTATYLVSIACYPYTRFSHWYTPLGGGEPMEVQYFVYPDHYTNVQTTYALTVPMIAAYAAGFGEYPFVNEKYGHAEFVWGGGMEHQTCTSLGGWSEDLISHELAHSWWGDMITCADFQHVWLNEGFATWCEAYWKEQTAGFATYQQYMDAAAYYGAGTIIVEDPLHDDIFSSALSYNKGSWVVHMLRGVLGDDDFFAGLAQYRATYAYGSATTEQLRDALEAVSGRDLDPFFQQWIYGEYFPIYEYQWNNGPGANQITLDIDQVQTNAGVFTMPITVRVVTAQGPVDLRVENSQASQSYVLTTPGAVTDVVLDPDHWILRQVRTTVSNPSLDQGILLVNGVDWNTYSPEIQNAYSAQAFWGDNPISFWDCFATPADGYPATLPPVLGHGAVPAGMLGQYSAVIWVGNDFNGDLADWFETPIPSYLEAGGNVLLMGRRSASFLPGALTDYLGVTWAEQGATLGNCVAAAPGLVNIPFAGAQSLNDVYLTALDPGSTLLFKSTTGFSGERGTGCIVEPPLGGTHRPDGGRLAQISGRPYRLNAAALRQNIEYILDHYFGEPYTPSTTAVPGDAPVALAALGPCYPNPFNPQTVIPFSLPRAADVDLTVFDLRGHRVRELAAGNVAAGAHQARWDGADAAGRACAAGTYFARLRVDGVTVQTRGLVLVR
jgi:aminopeptidase N